MDILAYDYCKISLICYEGCPESKDRLRIAYTYYSQYIVQTWPQTIFTCYQNWRNFWVSDTSKGMKKWRMPSRSG